MRTEPTGRLRADRADSGLKCRKLGRARAVPDAWHDHDRTTGGWKRRRPCGIDRRAFKQTKSGGVLLSQGVTTQVPSALAGLTSVFGMGTGVTPPLSPPKPVVISHESRPEAGPSRRSSRKRVPGRTRSFRDGSSLDELHSEHEHRTRDAKMNQALGQLVPVS